MPEPGRGARTGHLIAFVVGAVLGFGLTGDARASLLISPGVGARDQATNAAFMSEPGTPDSALFMNPAGLVAFEQATLTLSAGTARVSTEVDSDAAGYNRSDDRFAFLPSGAFSIPVGPGWRAAFGMFGSVGTVFDFEAEPPGVPYDFVSDVAIGSAPLALAREVTPNLWVGAELIGLLGYLRNRYTLVDPLGAAVPIKYTLRGPGLQAMVGLTWKPDDAWSVGLSLATPGKVWMDGSTVIGGERYDVDLDLKIPTTFWAGLTRHVSDRAHVAASFRWTDSSVFGTSEIEYADIEIAFVPDAHDEWRVALGGFYELRPEITLRAGTSYASRIVGNEGVSPLLFDGEDVKISSGFSYDFGKVTLDLMAGYAFEFARNVSADDALILPGEYTGSGPVFILGTTYEF